MERTADEMHPGWREQFEQTQRRLPPEKRNALGPGWQARQRSFFIKALLDWLGASPAPDVMADFCARLDAVLEFTIFVTREFLLQPVSIIYSTSTSLTFSICSNFNIGLRSVRNCKQRSGPVDEDSPLFPGGSNHVLL